MDLEANFTASVARSVSDGLLRVETPEGTHLHIYTLLAKTIEDLMARLQRA
jgi:hypothetical protein